jgi:predicted nuclease of predicted toxin-antitoxin system
MKLKFIVDECTGPGVANWLRLDGHDVFSVFEEGRGMTDDQILKKCLLEERILITNDKDFGEKAFKNMELHSGIILLRLQNESADSKIATLVKLFKTYFHRIPKSFIVLTENQVRFSRLNQSRTGV